MHVGVREIITKLSVRNKNELAAFENAMSYLTLGHSLSRSMSYSTFRLVVLQYHLTGEPTQSKCILGHNHFIAMDDGVATLYRIVDVESGMCTREEEYTDSDDDNPKEVKRRKFSGVSRRGV